MQRDMPTRLPGFLARQGTSERWSRPCLPPPRSVLCASASFHPGSEAIQDVGYQRHLDLNNPVLACLSSTLEQKIVSPIFCQGVHLI